jgi:putative ABC transport system permease protein
MFTRIVKESLVRKRRRKLMAVAAIALGATVGTAMLAVALGVGDKVNRELRSYGANIEAVPRQRALTIDAGGIQYQAAAPQFYLDEADLPKLKSIFWSNNILAFAPFLRVPARIATDPGQTAPVDAVLSGTWFDYNMATEDGKSFRTGVRQMSPWWKIQGSWPGEGECLIGTELRDKLHANPGDQITVARARPDGTGAPEGLKISGVLSTGSEEDKQVIARLPVAQRLADLPGKIDRVEVSAVTNPEDDFARRDPAKFTPEEYERWSCTPYVHSIALDVEKVLKGSDARPVLRIARTEGALLSKIELMLFLVAIAAMAAAVLGVASTMMTTVLERRSEIGLLKAIGASKLGVTAIFLAEAAVVGALGGLAGLALGYELAQVVARTVFGSAIAVSPVLAPIVLIVSIGVAFLGSAVPLRAALKFDPSVVLRGQ